MVVMGRFTHFHNIHPVCYQHTQNSIENHFRPSPGSKVAEAMVMLGEGWFDGGGPRHKKKEPAAPGCTTAHEKYPQGPFKLITADAGIIGGFRL